MFGPAERQHHEEHDQDAGWEDYDENMTEADIMFEQAFLAMMDPDESAL